MAGVKTTIKPYKLKPSGDNLSRDDLATWQQVLLSHMRQADTWRPFLPGGGKADWVAADSGEENDGWTNGDKAAFQDFLTCLATFSPTGFNETIKRESTSFTWVIDLIKSTFELKTRGEHFLALEDLKFDFSKGFTYQQAYMEVKDFVCASLLNDGDRFEGKALPRKEILSPVAKNFITKEWLLKIDPRLPKHIRDTRGHLFTDDKPTLSCNQRVICDQIPTMLAELDGKSDSGSQDVSIGYVPANRRGAFRPRGRGLLRGAGSQRGHYFTPPRAWPAPARGSTISGCQRCLEATPRRYDAAKTHATNDCIWPPNNPSTFRQRPGFRVVYVPETEDQSEAATEEYYGEQFAHIPQFYPEASIEEIFYNEDSENKSSSSYVKPFINEPTNVAIQALPVRKVQTVSANINNKVETLTIDSGSEGNCMREDICQKLGLSVVPLDADDSSVPTQADGQSPLDIVGQTEFIAKRGNIEFFWKGYVATSLSANILCGGPFMERNQIVQELHNNRLKVGKHYLQENSPFRPTPDPEISIANISKVQTVQPKILIGENVPRLIREKLEIIHREHEQVFNGDLSGGYNGYSGNHTVNFNFKGGIPPTPNYDSRPPYFSTQDQILLQAKIDELEDKGICVKVSDTDIIPKYAAPCMLAKKHSARDLEPGAYEKLSTEEKLKYNRFILCHNKLSEHVDKLPAKSNKLDETIRVVGSYEYVITTDLTDSFWQRHIAEDKLPYFAFHSPFRGPYIFLRSTQGLINQTEGLEQLVSAILQDCVMSGWCQVLADNIYIMGHTMEQTVKHWQIVLQLLSANNIKLSPKKTSCFPEKLDLLGWTKQGKYLVPDTHRQNVLAKAPLPVTVHQLRSYLGGYRTFFRCKKEMAHILKDLEGFTALKKSTEKLQWTEDLKTKFEESKKKILQLEKLYLPKQDDQLVMTSDWSEKGLSCTLWAMIENIPHVVCRFSARLDKTCERLLESSKVRPKTLPCDGEMTAVYVGIKSPAFSAYIRASTKRTVCLVDNKPVVEASKLIKDGKFSSSRVINNLMSALSEYNLEFQHLSSKMGHNLADDYASRNPAECEGKPECKTCSFIKDCEDLTIASLSFSVTEDSILGNVSQSSDLIQDIIKGVKSIPFNNRKALKYLQDRDEDLLKVRDYLTSGKRPTAKNTKENKVKRYLRPSLRMTIAADGCLICTTRDKQSLNMRELIVIPEEVSVGLIYALHVNLNHPTPYQLQKILDTKFFILDREKKVKSVSDSCTLCLSVAKIPREIETFKPNEIPDHPGQAFTVDILRMDKRKVLVAVENFSGFVSTAFVCSEGANDLVNGIIQTVSPFRSSITTNIRVDQAPGFKSLMKDSVALKELNISLELGCAKNKNALSLVDRKIQELEVEIKKISGNEKISTTILAKATTFVNEKIRQQGLSAKEILFSRDQFSQANLQLSDERISEDVMKRRHINNEFSARSKAQVNRKAEKVKVEKGNLVFLKQEGDKHHRRDLYFVLEILPTENSLIVAKLLHALSGNQSITFQPHNITYKVKDTDVILSPDQPSFHTQVDEDTDGEFYDEDDDLPDIKPKNPHYPYEDFSDDEFELEDNAEEEPEEHNNNEGEDESEYDSFSNDDYEDEADEENSDSQDSSQPEIQAESDQENILQENIQSRELEINNLIDNQEDLGAAGVYDQQNLDQNRQPRSGDIISFVHEDYWVTAKVKNKPRRNPNSHFYNIELEDGTETGVELLPPTADTVYSWTLLPESEWRPQQEQLRAAQCSAMGSKEPSPVSHIERREDLTSLYPEQQIQSGRVYSLPSTLPADPQLQYQAPQAQHYPSPAWSREQHEEYMNIYNKILRSYRLNPNNPTDENTAHFLVRDQLYVNQNSAFQKLKRAIFKRK